MHARFHGNVYHRHSHDTYSLGVTEWGAQSFTCRHAAYTSAAGMVMAFNPDDPHDGHAATDDGFSYRMIHIGPALVTEVLSDITGRPAGRPLFARPVLRDPGLARALYRLHAALTGQASPLERGERLTAAIAAAARAAAHCPPGLAKAGPAALRKTGPPGWSGTTWTRTTPPRSPGTSWRRRPGAAVMPRTGRSGRPGVWRPASTSGCSGCGPPASAWPPGCRRPRRPPSPASPTRRISPAGSAAATASPRPSSAAPPPDREGSVHGNSGGREEFSFTQFTISPGRSPIIDTASGCIDV